MVKTVRGMGGSKHCCSRTLGKGYGYKMYWKDMWLFKSNSDDNERLLHEIKPQHQT